MKNKQNKDKIDCYKCGIATNHLILSDIHDSISNEDGVFWDWYFQTVKCLGCDTISFRIIEYFSEETDEIGRCIPQITLFPSRLKDRSPIDNYKILPPRTRKVYLEILKSIDNDAPLLATIGLRTLIESICIELNTKTKTLASRIDELVELGILSKIEANFIHEHRLKGNVAAHEIIALTDTELEAAIDIAETILKTIYILPQIAKIMK